MITFLGCFLLLAGWAITLSWATRLRGQLRTDPLTGIANRIGLHKVFARARRGRGVSVLMLDLDDFKSINDTYGHRVGDLVLAEVGRRLRQRQRRGNLAVRLSGDEFAFWLGTFSDLDTQRGYADAVAAEIATVIAEPIEVAGLRLTVTASVGIGISPTKPEAVEQLLRPADRAMYRHKKPHPELFSRLATMRKAVG